MSIGHPDSAENEEFLHLFGDIEQALRRRLRLPARGNSALAPLIERYRICNPFWSRHAADLHRLREIRNFLTHERSHATGYPVRVSSASIACLRHIFASLNEPQPIATTYRRRVKTIQSDDSVASVLQLAFQNAYSQFPVVDNGRFNRLITENEIVRWLGRQINNGRVTVDFAKITVRDVLREREPESAIIFRFERLEAPEQEVMGLFQLHPALEVILLTENGRNNSPIEGIVTQWDAARYSP